MEIGAFRDERQIASHCSLTELKCSRMDFFFLKCIVPELEPEKLQSELLATVSIICFMLFG